MRLRMRFRAAVVSFTCRRNAAAACWPFPNVPNCCGTLLLQAELIYVLALQLQHPSFEVSLLCDGLVGAAPSGPRQDEAPQPCCSGLARRDPGKRA